MFVRWSLISGRLPGRTANDVKNYWNTRLNKKILSQRSDNEEKANKLETKKMTKVIKPQPRIFSKNYKWLRSATTSSDDEINKVLNGEILSDQSPVDRDQLVEGTPWWENILLESDDIKERKEETSCSIVGSGEENIVKSSFDEDSELKNMVDNVTFEEEGKSDWDNFYLMENIWGLVEADHQELHDII